MAGLIPGAGSPVWLVEERDNPTAAYYLRPALAAAGAAVTRRTLAAGPPEAADLDGTFVLLNRYLSGPWRRALAGARHRLAGLAYFLDDDLFDPGAWAGLPWRYRLKLWRLAGRHRAWLRAVGARVWVSTPHLAAKYAGLAPRLVPPAPLPEALVPGEGEAAGPGRRVFYHATASHRGEFAWLRPVVAALVSAEPAAEVELVGGREVVRGYAGLPGVTVVSPLPWESYRRFALWPGRGVGVAPLLPTAFNAARSHVKFFDITRSGAVGVYAAGSACAAVVTHGVDGLVAPMEPGAFAAAARELLADADRRVAMLAAARRTCARLDAAARRVWAGGAADGIWG